MSNIALRNNRIIIEEQAMMSFFARRLTFVGIKRKLLILQTGHRIASDAQVKLSLRLIAYRP